MPKYIIYQLGPISEIPGPEPEIHTCEETYDGIICETCKDMKYLHCGVRATHAVFHLKDRRVYYMCRAHADHNVLRRGGILVKEYLG